MSTNICNEVYADPALLYVDQGWTQFREYAESSYQLASQQVESITAFEIPFHTWDASFQADGTLSGFVRPERPDFPVIQVPELNATIPDAPTLQVNPVTIGPAPAEPAELSQMPSFLAPATPGELDAVQPGAAPTMNIPALPEAPVLSEPDAPVLVTVELPDVPDVTVTPFEEAAPEFTAPVPSEQVDFVESPYVSALLERVKMQVGRMLDGDFVLPEAVEQALFDRAVSRDDRSALKLEQEVSEQFGARGFEEPTGMQAARLLEVQQVNRDKRAEVNRDVYIQSEQLAIENLRFAVQQGLQLETTMLQAHLAVEQRKFDLAMKSKDVALAVFNAHVARYNAVVQAYNARIDAYKAFLDGLRAQVDVYRAQVDAAKVKGEINEQAVRAYAEQIRAQLARAEMFRAQIEGTRATIDAERARIDGYRAEVDAYRGRVEAYGVEWDAYRNRLQAEGEKGRIYETLAKVYATRVGAWQTQGDVRIQEHRGNLAAQEAFLRQHEGQIRAVLAKLESARVVVQAQASQAAATATIYSAEAQVESAAVEADTRAFGAETERSRTRVEMALRDAEMQVQQLLQRSNLLLRALESGSQASSQLAASSFSAMNFSAGISSSQSRSKSCGTSFSYSGEIADAGI